MRNLTASGSCRRVVLLLCDVLQSSHLPPEHICTCAYVCARVRTCAYVSVCGRAHARACAHTATLSTVHRSSGLLEAELE